MSRKKEPEASLFKAESGDPEPLTLTKKVEPPQQTAGIQVAPEGAMAITLGKMDYEGMLQNPDVLARIEAVERIIEMRNADLARIAKQGFNEAMSKFQRICPPIPKKLWNDQTRSSYADHDAMMVFIQPFLDECGLVLNLSSEPAGLSGYLLFKVYITHGTHTEIFKSVIAIDDGLGIKGNASKTKLHGAGSTITYGMRYSIKQALNLRFRGDDNDGNAPATPAPTLSQEQIAELKGFVESKKLGSDGPLWRYLGVVKGRYDLIYAHRFPSIMNDIRNQYRSS